MYQSLLGLLGCVAAVLLLLSVVFLLTCIEFLQVRSLEEEIDKEKGELNKTKASQEASLKKLKTELSGTKQKLQETEVSDS